MVLVAQARQPQEHPVALLRGDERGLRLVLQPPTPGGIRGVVSPIGVVGRVRRDGVGIAAPVQGPEAGLEVGPVGGLDVGVAVVTLREDLRLEDGVLAVVGRRPGVRREDEVVVGVPERCRGKAATQASLRGAVGREAVLLRPDEEQARHAHLHVLDVLEVAVVHVRAGVTRHVVVGEVAADRHRERQLRDAVEDRRLVDEAVPVDGVAVDQVGPLREPQVAELDAEALALVERQQRGADLGLPALLGHLRRPSSP